MDADTVVTPWDLCSSEKGCIEYLIKSVHGDSEEATRAMRAILSECLLKQNRDFAVDHPLGQVKATQLFFKAFREFRMRHAHLQEVHGQLLASLKAVKRKVAEWEKMLSG